MLLVYIPLIVCLSMVCLLSMVCHVMLLGMYVVCGSFDISLDLMFTLISLKCTHVDYVT